MTNRLAQDDQGLAVPVMALGTAYSVSLSTTTARSSQITGGDRTGSFVWLIADADCFVEVGDSAVEATTSDHYLKAGERLPVYLPAAARYVAGIVASGTGNLYISQLDGTR